MKFTVKWGALEVKVDWDGTTVVGAEASQLTEAQIDAMNVTALARALIDYKDTGYIRTGNPTCRNASEVVAEQDRFAQQQQEEGAADGRQGAHAAAGVAAESGGAAGSEGGAWEDSCPPCEDCPPCPLASRARPPQACSWTHPEESWGLVTCMENMRLGGTEMKGNGRDAFWPPSAKTRDWTLEDEIGIDNYTTAHCGSAPNLVGGPTEEWTHGDWLAAYYDEANQTHHANIVWSNGQLDPWSGGGHYGDEGRDGPLVQKLPGRNSGECMPMRHNTNPSIYPCVWVHL